MSNSNWFMDEIKKFSLGSTEPSKKTSPEFEKEYMSFQIKWLENCVKELKQSQQWKPIETAPRDGTTVLLSFHYLNGVHPGKSFVAMLEWNKATGGWGLFKNLELDGTLKVSHWMPIPEPPKQ